MMSCIAVHEAAHALAFLHAGAAVEEIVAARKSGHCLCRAAPTLAPAARLLAADVGAVAERILCGRLNAPSPSDADRHMAAGALAELQRDGVDWQLSAAERERRRQRRADAFAFEQRDGIAALAAALVEAGGTLRIQQLRTLCRTVPELGRYLPLYP